MSKRLSPRDVETLLYAALNDSSQREAAAKGCLKFAAVMGFSPAKPEDGWSLAFMLFLMSTALLRGVRGDNGKPAGRKTTLDILARDAITMFGIHIARRNGDTRGERPIIRHLAQVNGWPSDNKAVNTLWRRYQSLKDPASRERKALVKALREDPVIAAALAPQSGANRLAAVMRKSGSDSA